MKQIANSKIMVKSYILLTIIFTCSFSQSFAQFNLVRNPSFEEYTTCPYSAMNPPLVWYSPTNYGISYYNQCSSSPLWSVPYNFNGFNYQYPRTGNAYVGIYLVNQPGADMRNYFQIKLKDSLSKGKCYYAEFYVVSDNYRKFKCNNVSCPKIGLH